MVPNWCRWEAENFSFSTTTVLFSNTRYLRRYELLLILKFHIFTRTRVRPRHQTKTYLHYIQAAFDLACAGDELYRRSLPSLPTLPTVHTPGYRNETYVVQKIMPMRKILRVQIWADRDQTDISPLIQSVFQKLCAVRYLERVKIWSTCITFAQEFFQNSGQRKSSVSESRETIIIHISLHKNL